MNLLRIKNDLAFKFVFGRDEEKCKAAMIKLLNIILDTNIKSIVYMNPINIPQAVDEKETEYDIKLVADDGNKTVDIEIQLNPHEGFRNRLVFYGAQLMVRGALKAGESYDYLRKCIVVSILDFNLLGSEGKDFMNTFYLKEKDKNIVLSDVMSIVTLEMTKLNKKSVKDMTEAEKMLNYLKYAGEEGYEDLVDEIVKESEAVWMANQLLLEISNDDQIREKVLARENHERIIASRLKMAENNGITIGKTEGIKIGKTEGEIVGQIKAMVFFGMEEASILNKLHEQYDDKDLVNRIYNDYKEQ